MIAADVGDVVHRFLKAQSDRNLDLMCELADDDIEYDNEPLPQNKKIRGREMFRQFFQSSPCIWCDEAELRELRVAVDHKNGRVLTERLDRFKIDGKWLEIPICGAFDVVNGKVRRWKDYWDYGKYKENKEKLFGPTFSLFKPRVFMPPKRWVVICSPVSGPRLGQKVVEQHLMPAWQKAVPELEISVVYTERYQHAVELAQQHGSKECGLVAVGGDGTIHEVLDGLLEKGVLEDTPLAVLSQGTMNFYSVTAGLPAPDDIPKLIASNSMRHASLMRVEDGADLASISFEALHIGRMPYRVCMGVKEWRSTMGPMFGIFANLIGGNAIPSQFCHSGMLTLHPVDGSPQVRKIDNFFWIVASHRNPYNGCVGYDMWVSFMTLDKFPGFSRMMQFFKPPMEHFCGLAYSFEEHYRVMDFEFINDAGWTGVVLDGDAYPAGKVVSVRNVPRAMQLVAPPQLLERLPKEYYSNPPVTPAAQAWLAKHPPPKGTHTSVIVLPSSKL